MAEFRLAVFIGRFQPFHNSHLKCLLKGLEEADKVLILLGSHRAASNIRNPFNSDERRAMILSSLTDDQVQRVHFANIRDYYYSDAVWITEVQTKVAALEDHDSAVCLLGTYKDQSSYYLNLFPQWHKAIVKVEDMDATTIREIMFNRLSGSNDLSVHVPPPILDWLANNFLGTPRHAMLMKEHEFLDKYKRAWALAPYPVTFVTADAVVVKSGHVLMVKRKTEPGKGLWALPGGFIKANERLFDAAIRELKEETAIQVQAQILRSLMKESHVFDHPGRSLRGRTITHAFYFDLGTGELPHVKGDDDAEAARWVSLMDLNEDEDKIFEDHAHIIRHFISRQ